MGIINSHRFPVQAHWWGGRLVRLRAPEKPPFRVATPPEFKDGIPGIWSPEELLVGALASCYQLTLLAVAEQRGLPIHTLDVSAAGHLERAASGGYGFTIIDLVVELTTDPGREAEAEDVAHHARRVCAVGRALEVPVLLLVKPRALALAEVVSA